MTESDWRKLLLLACFWLGYFAQLQDVLKFQDVLK